jgi:hypothetical protein
MGAGGAGVLVDAAEPATATPHLLQKLDPGFRAAPQELQNAINHRLIVMFRCDA